MNEQVFISHSSSDQVWANMIAQALEENGIRCWYDVHSIGPGDDYDEEIFKAIKRCPIFLLVLTENAVKATFVIKELGLAVREHKTIIPVKIGEFDLGKFWLKLENVQIYELGRSWNTQKMAALTDEIRVKLDLVPINPVRPQPPAQRPKGLPARLKWAVAVPCAILVLLLVLGAISSQGPGRSTAGNDKDSVVSTAPSDEPEEISVPVISAEPMLDRNTPTKLTAMHIMDAEMAEVKDEMVNSVGQTCKDILYVGSYYSTGGNPHVQYYLGGEYSWFTGTLSCPDQMESGYYCVVRVYLDSQENEPVFERKMDRSTVPAPLSVDVSGCQTMILSVDVHEAGHNRGEIIVSDGLLYGKDADVSGIITAAGPSDTPESAPPEVEPTKLVDMHVMASDHAKIQENAANTVGETYDKAVYLYSPPAWTYVRKPYIKFYLGGQYSLFTGTVSCPDEAHYSGYKFQIFLDDAETPVVDMALGRSTPPTPLEIDVSGCQIITFIIDTPGNVGAMIPDGLLTP